MIPIEDLYSVLQSLPGREPLPPDCQPVLDAVLAFWQAAPVELGNQQAQPQDLPAFRIDVFSDEQICLPEARLTSLWRQALETPLEAHQVSLVLELAAQPLWEPAQAWVFRLLAASGCRKEIASLLPAGGALTLPQAEAALEAHFPPGVVAPFKPVIQTHYPQELARRWEELLRLEVDACHHSLDAALEGQFLQLMEFLPPDNLPTWLAGEHHRISARACAAFIRQRLGRDLDDGGLLASALFARLPAWERHLLHGLVAWQQGCLPDAHHWLAAALEAAPWQSAARESCARLLSQSRPAEALHIVSQASSRAQASTRQEALVRLALLCRLGFQEQPDFLACRESINDQPSECLRWRWVQADAHNLRQERLLVAASHVRQGDLTTAERLIHTVLSSPGERNLQLALASFAAMQALEDRPGDQSWQADMLRRKVNRAHSLLAHLPPAGDADLQFFQAALSATRDAQLSLSAIQSLLRQRHWCERECRTGGSRLLYLADLSLRLGRPDLTLRICDCLDQTRRGGPVCPPDDEPDNDQTRMGESDTDQTRMGEPAPPPGGTVPPPLSTLVRVRRLTAGLLLALQNNVSVDEIPLMVEQILSMDQGQAKSLPLLAAVASLLAGGAQTAQFAGSDTGSLAKSTANQAANPAANSASLPAESIRQARQHGAPEALCRFLESLANHQPLQLSLAEIQSLPTALRPSACLLSGAAPLDTRLKDYITAVGLDWEKNPPLDALELARHVLVQVIKHNRQEELQQWLTLLEGTDRRMFEDLARRTRLLSAVRLGLQGDLPGAETRLMDMEGA